MSEYIFKSRCTDDFELDERDKTNPVDWYGTLHGEIVRCRDCRYMGYGTWGGERPMVCKRRIRAYQVQPDGFCAWASKREGAES